MTVRVTLATANAYVAAVHRHHKPVAGHLFSVGVAKDGTLCGVAIVGRPVARMVDQVTACEVLRCCTNGTRNACSWLYGRCARVAQLLGFARIQTYVLIDETGTSLLAAGWRLDGTTDGGLWDRPSRERGIAGLICAKQRWVRDFVECV